MVNRKKEFLNLVTNLNQIPRTKLNFEIENVQKSPFRQHFHIESPFGMLGDPNGFSYFNGKYHLFHQWFPMKYSKNPNYFQEGWYHWISDNLIDWHPLGEAMSNDTSYDKYGVYSGSALPVKDRLFLMYNGNNWINTETNNWKRVPSQLGAFMDINNHVEKLKTPLIIGPLKGYTGHFRDPKIFRKNNRYYAVTGAQRHDLKGTVLFFESEDLRNWKNLGEIKPDFNKTGYMWECPDYFEINNKGILLFCPQGLLSDGNQFLNAFQACYALGDPIDFNNLNFNAKKFNEIDLGFDFYAPQTMLSTDGRRILSAWMAVMNSNSPTVKYHYDGCEIFPRELTIKNNKLFQRPIREIKLLYKKIFSNKIKVSGLTKIEVGNENCRDIKMKINCLDSKQFIFDLFADKEDQERLRLIFNKMKNRFIIDRSKAGIDFESEFGNERSCSLDLNKEITLRIVQDISSAEIFLNNGEKVFTMRIFTKADNNRIFAHSLGGESQIQYSISQLRQMK